MQQMIVKMKTEGADVTHIQFHPIVTSASSILPIIIIAFIIVLAAEVELGLHWSHLLTSLHLWCNRGPYTGNDQAALVLGNLGLLLFGFPSS